MNAGGKENYKRGFALAIGLSFMPEFTCAGFSGNEAWGINCSRFSQIDRGYPALYFLIG